MFDIYFPDPMHQTVNEVDDAKIDDESLVFDFDLDLPKSDDYPVIIHRPIKSDGCTCKKCGDVYPYAEPNQDDGSFKCYSCRKYG